MKRRSARLLTGCCIQNHNTLCLVALSVPTVPIISYYLECTKEYHFIPTLGVGVCGGEDDLKHISQCFGYSSTPSGDHSELGQVQ